MNYFRLTPDAASSDPRQSEIRPAGLGFSIFYGGVSFAGVSALAYSVWAFRLVPGAGLMYAAVAAVYMVLSGPVLIPLVLSRPGRKRFPLLFAGGFLLYAVVWCAFWFGLRGKYLADLWGAALGLMVLTWLLQRAFGARGMFLRLFAGLFVLHSAGYYLGGELHALVSRRPGMLLYGVGHGLGFGAGLGWVLFHCQAELRNRVKVT